MAQLKDLYRLTSTILQRAGHTIVPSDDEKLRELQRAMADFPPDYQKALNNIFLPLKQLHRGQYIGPPLRWEEPRVKQLLSHYFALLDERDDLPRGAELRKDPVYMVCQNPDIRRLFEKRKGAEEYQQYLKYLPQTTLLLSSPGERSVTIYSKSLDVPRQILKQHQQQEYFDKAPDAILALEAGINPHRVRTLKESGYNGAEIMDVVFFLRKRATNLTVVRELKHIEIDDSQWEDLIDVAREIQVPVKRICLFLLKIDVDEILSVQAEFASMVPVLARRMRRSLPWTWYLVLGTYCDLRDLDRVRDHLFKGLDRSFHWA